MSSLVNPLEDIPAANVAYDDLSSQQPPPPPSKWTNSKRLQPLINAAPATSIQNSTFTLTSDPDIPMIATNTTRRKSNITNDNKSASTSSGARRNARYRTRLDEKISQLTTKYNEKRAAMNLPTLTIVKGARPSRRGTKRPDYNPPPEQMAVMSSEDLTEWRARARKKRKAEAQKLARQKKKVAFDELSREVREWEEKERDVAQSLLCLTGNSVEDTAKDGDKKPKALPVAASLKTIPMAQAAEANRQTLKTMSHGQAAEAKLKSVSAAHETEANKGTVSFANGAKAKLKTMPLAQAAKAKPKTIPVTPAASTKPSTSILKAASTKPKTMPASQAAAPTKKNKTQSLPTVPTPGPLFTKHDLRLPLAPTANITYLVPVPVTKASSSSTSREAMARQSSLYTLPVPRGTAFPILRQNGLHGGTVPIVPESSTHGAKGANPTKDSVSGASQANVTQAGVPTLPIAGIANTNMKPSYQRTKNSSVAQGANASQDMMYTVSVPWEASPSIKRSSLSSASEKKRRQDDDAAQCNLPVSMEGEEKTEPSIANAAPAAAREGIVKFNSLTLACEAIPKAKLDISNEIGRSTPAHEVCGKQGSSSVAETVGLKNSDVTVAHKATANEINKIAVVNPSVDQSTASSCIKQSIEHQGGSGETDLGALQAKLLHKPIYSSPKHLGPAIPPNHTLQYNTDTTIKEGVPTSWYLTEQGVRYNPTLRLVRSRSI